MGSLRGVDIAKGTVGANAIAPASSISALLALGMAVASKLELSTAYSVTSLKQAETTLGITAAYDTTNSVVLHQHIKDFYSFKKNAGVKLFIMVLPIASVPATVIEDTAGVAARKLLIAGAGTIKNLAVAINLATGATETNTDGLNTLVRASIAKAQLLHDWAYTTDRACNILLEGRGMASAMSTWINLRNIPVGDAVVNANNVSVVVGQDFTYSGTRANLPQKYAGVGKALGAMAVAALNQSICEVDENAGLNLSNALTTEWVTGALSNRVTIDDADDFVVELTNKGYIFPYAQTGVSGLRFNTDATCTPITVDEDGNMNEHTIYYGRTMDAAALRLKQHLVNLVKKRVTVNPTTGKLPTAIIKQIEADADNKVFAKMFNEGLITEGKTIINANSNVQPPANLLEADFELVPTAIIDKIQGTIYLRKTISI